MKGERTSLFQRVWLKIRYRLFLQEVLSRIAGSGFRVQVFHLVLEGLFDKTLPQFEDGFEEYDVSFLGMDDMKEIASIPERPIKMEKLLGRLKEGKKCFSVRWHGRVIAYTWCDLDQCHVTGWQFPLKDNEAYLFDAYTIREFRGKKIAPYIRYQCYKELARLGRDRLYSITAYFNTSSARFKEKLNAKPLELFLILDVFKKWCFSVQLKKYKAGR